MNFPYHYTDWRRLHEQRCPSAERVGHLRALPRSPGAPSVEADPPAQPSSNRPAQRSAGAGRTERSAGHTVLAVSALLWAAAFGVLHVAWATGSRVGLTDPSAADAAFGLVWFQTYNAAVALGCLVLVAGTFSAITPAPPRRAVRSLFLLASGLLLLRGGIGAGQLTWMVATGQPIGALAGWWVDGYLVVGGALFAALSLRTTAPAPDRDRCGPTPGTP